MNEVKENRITEEIEAQTEKLRTQISRTRQRLMKADDAGKSIEPYQREIKRLKKELAKLEGHWQLEFTISFTKQKSGDYLAEAKYHNRVWQTTLYKDVDNKFWVSPDVTGKYKTLKKLKESVTENVKYHWGIK